MSETQRLIDAQSVRERFNELMRRYVHAEDAGLTDDGLVRAVLIIDVNE